MMIIIITTTVLSKRKKHVFGACSLAWLACCVGLGALRRARGGVKRVERLNNSDHNGDKRNWECFASVFEFS